MSEPSSMMSLSLDSHLSFKLEQYLHEEVFDKSFKVSKSPYGVKDGVRGPTEIRVQSYDAVGYYAFTLYVFQGVYPSQIAQLAKRFNKRSKKGNDVYIDVIGAPKFSKESRRYLQDLGQPYVDLAGGFYLHLQLPDKELKVLIDRDESYEAEKWIRRESSGVPGAGRGRVVIYRALLVNQGKVWGVRELARATQMDPGTTSRYLQEVVKAGWVKRQGRSEHLLVDPSALLDYWAGMAKRLRWFPNLCRMPARDYPDMRDKIADFLKSEPDAYHTLWSGAEFYGDFTQKPIVALYCPDPWSAMKSLNAKMTSPDQNGNLWLLHPFEKEIGLGAVERQGERVVCWQQVYVDLVNAPHRGKSIAAMLRQKMEVGYGKE
jgi:hypothetical protein